jgi:hypothetical protein
MRKLWRWAAVGVGATAMAAGLTVTAMPTGASAKPATTVTQSQQHIVTASCTTARNYKGGYLTFTHCDDQYYRHRCTPQTGEAFGPLYAANGCSTQVYLYVNARDFICVNPQSSTGVLKRDYETYEITDNTGRC